MITLRPLELSDASQLATLANNKNIWNNLRDYIPFPYNENDAKSFITQTKQEDPKQNFGIEYKGNLCGVIGVITQNDVYRKTAEIGYWIGEPYWGKGIATKAIALITHYGFEQLELIRIHAGVFEYNISSMKALEKNGYMKDGIFKKAIIKNEKIYDEHRYYIIRDEYTK
ncbi:GNAT family protein [uncultured Dokdonia sp.]|uniref:GNAT family N-acetyltransferase n=1 Tax=uncultured Dokdonia sp. TaxID=575653 RepID=UPI002626832F|nr:GNAT family protein [uncultured Dokdonia sp.]